MSVAVILLAFLLLAGCTDPMTQTNTVDLSDSVGELRPCIPEWTEIEPGLRYRALNCDPETNELDLHLIEADAQQLHIDAWSDTPTTAPRLADELDLPFAINANFFDENRQPLGVVIREGDVLQAPTPVEWASIFLIDSRSRPAILTPEQWPPPRPVQTAVQAGPRLVIAGKPNDVLQAVPSLRSGVCIKRNQQLVFFVTPSFRFFDVHEMVDIASRSEADGGLGCRDAMLFDGGPSAQLFVRLPRQPITMDGDRVPVFITASRP